MRRTRLICAQLLACVLALGAFAVNATACEGGGGGGGELTSLSTKLSGAGKEGETLTVSEGTKVKDKATLTGKNASKATGKVTYKVYSESACKTLVTSAGEVTVSGESVPASSEEELEAGKAYYWQAHYGGDSNNAESTSPCTEVLDVQAKTTLSTKLSGESKEGEELTIDEGSKAKDTATLSGTNSAGAGGKLVYKIYSDKECKTLVKEASEVTVSSGSVPASSEEELEGGKTYYWQATYKGDSLHLESTSSCGKEVLKVKAKTTLATTLSGEGKEGAELTVLEGAKVKDKATVEGTNSSGAEGKALYKVYSDSKCEHLVSEAGEKSVTSGNAAASSKEELEGAKTYYWQATYKGDSLHQESTSSCGKEVLTVKAKTSLSTTLAGEGKEGSELTVLEGSRVKDDATLEGTYASTAGGTVAYKIYSDKECKDLVAEAGEKTVSTGSVPASNEEEREGAKTYYWQASYDGDSLHQASTSECGKEVLTVKAKTTLTTSLSGEGKEGSELTVLEDAKVKDDATLGGSHSSSASGKVLYSIYSDKECKHLVATAGEKTVSSGSVPSSSEEELEGGKTYYWQATYTGDSLHQESTSECGAEVTNVKAKTAVSTTLSGEGKEGTEIEVLETSAIRDTAALSGANVDTAGGTIKYDIYSDKECEDLVAEAGEKTVSSGSVPASNGKELAAGTYYWQASYSGDVLHQSTTSACGDEVAIVKSSTALTTSLSGEAKSGAEIEVLESSGIADEATLSGTNAPKAGGTVKYDVYSDKECKTLVAEAGEVTVSSGSIPASDSEKLKAGTYYWQATYSGDSLNEGSKSACGSEIAHVKTTTSLTTSLAGEEQAGETLVEGAEITLADGGVEFPRFGGHG
jgi:predicted  nucleic acid-binding Zn ribbon protein